LCLPFCVFTAICFLAIAVRSNTLEIPVIIGLFSLALYPVTALFVLTLVSASVVAAWFKKTKTTVEIVFISLYSVIIMFYILFAVWCLITHPSLDL
jgi:hypothetical protein